jgi:tetratricopeptide (TPR) repeat protein
MNLPQSLLEAVKQRKLVVFVGPEVSADLKNTAGKTLGSPTHQLDEMIHHLVKRASNVNFLYQVLEERGPEAVLNEIEKSPHVSRLDVHDFLREYMQLSAENDFSLHEKIAQLSHLVVTTTLDKAFETCSPLLSANVVSYGKNVEGAKVYIGQPVLFKLFGDVAGTTPVVVVPSDCERFYENKTIHSGLAMELLEELTRGKTILFIGCKPDDFQLRSIFRAIDDKKEQHVLPHFILTSEPEGWSADFLHPMVVENRSALEAVIDELIKAKADVEVTWSSPTIMPENRRFEVQQSLIATTSKVSDLILSLYDEALDWMARADMYQAIRKWKQISVFAPCHAVYAEWANALQHLAANSSGEESVNWFRQALEKYELAVGLNPEHEHTYCQYGKLLEKRGDDTEGKEADTWYEQAIEKYKKALAINPDCVTALEHWGNILLGTYHDKKVTLYPVIGQQATTLFERAIELKPHEAKYHHSLALAINLCIRSYIDEKINSEYDRCIKHLEIAARLQPDLHDLFINWGYILGHRAEYIVGNDGYTLYNQAFDKFKKAAEYQPNDARIYFLWGMCLREYAFARRGKYEEPAFVEACEKYKKAVELKPDYHQAYDEWATTLDELMRLRNNEDDKATQMEMEEKLLLSYEHGGECWALAYWYCRRGDKKKALKYLEISLQRDELMTEDICNEYEDSLFKDDKDFNNLLKKYLYYS